MVSCHMVADPCQIVFGQLKTHDLNLSRDSLTSSPWLKKGDNLNVDRGFLDHLLMRDFNEKGVSVTVPTKKNMEIYKEAVAIAIKENDWGIHPNPKRKKQKIQLVKNLMVSEDKKYAYAVILCTDTRLTAREIIENYETRWRCEEDYRQLKEF